MLNTKPLRIPYKTESAGFTLIEALVAISILAIGLLGLAGMMLHANRTEFESYQKKQALILLQDMVDRIENNRLAASCYAITTDAANGTPYLGSGGASIPTCTGGFGSGTQLANQRARAESDLQTWSNTLQGTAEVTTISGTNSNTGGAMNARGCIVFDGTVTVGTGSYKKYTVSVAWQAKGETAAPSGTALNCAKNSYSSGNDNVRRAISLPVWIPDLAS